MSCCAKIRFTARYHGSPSSISAKLGSLYSDGLDSGSPLPDNCADFAALISGISFLILLWSQNFALFMNVVIGRPPSRPE